MIFSPFNNHPVRWNDIKQFAPSIALLTAANLVPLVGVIWFEWNVFAVLVLFWIENIIIGLYNVPRIVMADAHNNPDMQIIGDKVVPAIVWGIAAFFLVHYGLFTYGHGTFVFSFLGAQPDGTHYEISDVFTVIREYGLIWAVLALIVSHGFSLAYNYVYRGRYKETFFIVQMFAPYSRVIMLHMTIILGGGLIMILGEPILGLMILLVIKIFMDIRAHVSEQLGQGASFLDTLRQLSEHKQKAVAGKHKPGD